MHHADLDWHYQALLGHRHHGPGGANQVRFTGLVVALDVGVVAGCKRLGPGFGCFLGCVVWSVRGVVVGALKPQMKTE